jgi:MoxR-like ATPase
METFIMTDRDTFLQTAATRFGDNAIVTRKQILALAEELGMARPRWFFSSAESPDRGKYQIPPIAHAQVIPMTPRQTKKFDPNATSEHDYVMVPGKDKTYVPFGEFKDVERIIRSRKFFPVFISGLSGNGKTFMVEQACARAGRQIVRIQMSRETDEDDLIGGFRLIDGETKFLKGPVLRAMELGAVMLLDEADRADPTKIMCLQGILEGKPYFVKKTGEVVHPAEGFNIFVTANTKGRGSDDGRYVAASMLDDALLERFPITIEQDYPATKIETKILQAQFDNLTPEHQGYIDHLVAWADVIRRSFAEGASDEVISTRRLVHIIRAYQLFDDRMRAIEMCTNRFDEETKKSFLDLYRKVDPTLPKAPEQPAPEAADITNLTGDEIPF